MGMQCRKAIRICGNCLLSAGQKNRRDPFFRVAAISKIFLPWNFRRTLFDFDLVRNRRGRSHLLFGQVDRQHAVLDLGRNLLAVYVVGQRETLLERGVGEFAPQVGSPMSLLLVLVAFLLLLLAAFLSEMTNSLSAFTFTLKSSFVVPGTASSTRKSFSFSMMLIAGTEACLCCSTIHCRRRKSR